MTRVILASENPSKKEATRRAFQQALGDRRLDLHAMDAPSGVGGQPLSDCETYWGAIGRAQRARELCPDADFWVGIEGGVDEAGPQMVVVNWAAVLSRSGMGTSRAPTFPVPKDVAAAIRLGTSLWEAIERHGNDVRAPSSGEDPLDREAGAVGEMTRGQITRTQLQEQPIVLALSALRRGWVDEPQSTRARLDDPNQPSAGDRPVIRRVRPLDLDSIVAMDPIATRGEDRAWLIKRWIFLGQCYLLEESTDIVGYAALERSFFGHDFVAMLYVDSDHRRHGRGAAFMRHLETLSGTGKLFTSTNRSNMPMRRLLEKLGYIQTGTIDGLDEGDPELVYSKQLSSLGSSRQTDH